jgi:hypothetical protein
MSFRETFMQTKSGIVFCYVIWPDRSGFREVKRARCPINVLGPGVLTVRGERAAVLICDA